MMADGDVQSRVVGAHYELVDIKTFLAVVEGGSISQASRILDISKSVVSHRLRRLEGALNAELLRRGPRGVELTDQGTIYLEQVADGVLLIESAAESLLRESMEVSGVLRVSAPMSFGTMHLSRMLISFMRQYPKLSLQLDLHDHRVDIQAEGYDLGLRICRDPKQEGLPVFELGVSRRCLCCSPDYLEQAGGPSQLSDLRTHQMIGYSNMPLETLLDLRPEDWTEGTGPFPGRVRANNGEVMRDAAIAGLGITVLPLFIVADDLMTGRLTEALPGFEPSQDYFVALCPPRRSRLLKVRLLLEHLKKAFASPLPWDI